MDQPATGAGLGLWLQRVPDFAAELTNWIGEYRSGSRWLGNLDSNQDKQSQSLLCYRYTIPQWIVEQLQ